MSLVHVGDHEKIEGSRLVHTLLRADDPNPAAATVDAGTQYGVKRQAGDDHATAMAGLRVVLEAWSAQTPAPWDTRQRAHIGDNEKIALATAAVPIIQTREGTDIAAALFDLGCQYGQVVQDTGSLERAFRHVGATLVEWYPGIENPFPGPAVEPHAGPLRGYLQSSSRGWLHDGGQPCAPIGLMCGDGLLAKSEGKDVYTGILVPAARAGFHYTMPWSPLIWRRGQGGRFWGDRTFSPLSVPNCWDHVREWVQWSKSLELKVFLAHGGLAGATNAEEDAYVHGLIDLMASEGPEHFIFPMMANEFRDTGDRDDLDPREHVRLISKIHDRFPEVPYLIGSWTGDPAREDVDRVTRALKVFAPESNHGCFHGHRHGDFAQKIRRCWNYPYETYRGIADCWVNDESVGPQGRNGHLSEMHNAHEMDHHFMHAFMAISVLARTCVGFTCSPSVIFDEPFEDIPGFTTAVGFAREIPAEATTYRHAIHSGGTSQESQRYRVFEAEGDIRVDGRVDDEGNFCFEAYGQDVARIGSGLRMAQSAEFDLVTTDREVHSFRVARGQRMPRVPVTKAYLLRGRRG